MHDKVGQSEFENSDEAQIKQEDDFDYRSEQDRSRSPRDRNTREREGQGEQSNPENEIITRSTKSTRDMSLRESRYKIYYFGVPVV